MPTNKLYYLIYNTTIILPLIQYYLIYNTIIILPLIQYYLIYNTILSCS